FVLPGQQHVADPALHERRGRAARAGVEYGDVAEQLRDEVSRLRVASAVLPLRVLPRGQIVPARAAGRLRVWRDDRDARLHQIAPVLDRLWIALTHQEDNRGRVRRAVLRQALLPSLIDQAAL